MNKLKRPNQPGPLTKKLAAEIANRYANVEAAEQASREQAKSDIGSIAQDPIAALFTGIRFRTPTDRGILESKVRTYCYRQITDNWTDAQNKHEAEKAVLRKQISALRLAVRTAKQRNAEDVIEAISCLCPDFDAIRHNHFMEDQIRRNTVEVESLPEKIARDGAAERKY